MIILDRDIEKKATETEKERDSVNKLIHGGKIKAIAGICHQDK